MNKIMNSNHLNTIDNFHHIYPLYHQKKNSCINPCIFNSTLSTLNTIHENHLTYNKLRVSYPIKSLKNKSIFTKLDKKTIESSFSPNFRIKKIQSIFVNNNNNNAIYYSNHKNNINSFANSEMKPFYRKMNQNDSKESVHSTNLRPEINLYKTDKDIQNYNVHNKNKTIIINSYLDTEIRDALIKNNKTIKQLLNMKNPHNSFNLKYNNKKTKLCENAKNNDSVEKNKRKSLNKVDNINKSNNNLIKKKGGKKENNNLIKSNEYNKKNLFVKSNKNSPNYISPQKLLLINKKKNGQNSSRLSINKTNKQYIKKNLDIPKTINPKEFKIIEEIGCGSFGKIYKTIWNKNNRKYAMKIMYTKNEENMLYLQEKIHLIMDFEEKTKCDGLIKIYGDAYIKKGDDYYYYEMIELAERDWEQEIIIRKKNLTYYSEWELFVIMSQLIKALALLQKNHITHRDIKIQNILLLKNKYKICDFGEARKLNQKGVIVQPARGSELYMSPIQFFGLNQQMKQVQHNTYKSDVFSLGMCILYAATLSDDCLYDIRELTDMNMIKNILESYLYNNYSIGFIRLLLCLLEINEKKRPDFIQLENIISKIKINQ